MLLYIHMWVPVDVVYGPIPSGAEHLMAGGVGYTNVRSDTNIA